ncbi:MAG: PDZ domain-containing protein [Proteobacteria bacterium]|jgi:tricorn protease|nr:PDZ domain-containing protein [Pseudomonadota bacterium]
MSCAGYLRQPTVAGNTLAFVCDDDVWCVGAGGGIARRLTAGLGEPSTPVLSRDGRWLAYVSRDEQHPEVYLMPAEGGPAKRMTWLGPDVMTRGFTPDGKILFVTTWGQPFFRNYRAFTLDVAGGMPEMLPLGQVNHLAFGPGHAMVIGRNTADPARWKRYRGGTAGHLWCDAEGSGTFTRLASLAGNLTCPMWLGERIYYLSDGEGIGNLYSCRPDGSDVRRHTDHDEYFARNAQTDGARIVYQCAAALWIYDPATGRASEVPVEVPAHRTQAARRFVAAADHLQSFNVHPAGHSLAVDTRGKLYTFGLWEGAVHQHGVADGVRYRHGQWLADGETLVAVSDESGEERLVVFREGRRQARDWDVGRVIAMAAAPHGRRIALANHRNEVLIADLEADALVAVDRSDAGRSEDLAWSPDGKWLAYTSWINPRHCAIKLHDVAHGGSTLVTQPDFRDYSPAFDPAGKYLYFLSVRTFDPVYDAVQFELSFPRAARPYLVALAADAAPPFDPPPRGLAQDDRSARTQDADASDGGAARSEGSAPRAGVPATPPDVRVDLDGIAQRIAAFPVREGRYGRIGGVAGQKVVWTLLPIAGALGRGGHKESPGTLEVFDFDTRKTETLHDRADDFVLSADHKTIVVRDDKRLRAIRADRATDPRERGTAAAGDEPSRRTGWIDLARVRVSVEPPREWAQMLREVWRLQRDQFWVPDMSGIDWDAVYRRYAPLLPRVATRSELSDLIWELQGELGTSHAYEMGGDHRRPPQVALGHLAADLRAVDGGRAWEITRIVDGDSWDAAADSPLNAIGVQVRIGERIVAVNGQAVGPDRPPQALLVNQAGARVELTLAAAPGPGGAAGAANAPVTRTVVVTALTDEVPARYREWVESNRRFVHERSGGRVGYLHLPDMMSAGFAEFHRYFAGECDRDALIVDLRYNRGGHVSQLLLEKVARRRVGYDLSRWGRPEPYPSESPAGPIVALTNEHAGSDGDIFSHCFKLMKLGTLVGTRTWGGVIGIYPRHPLVDGSETTQPEFSFWFADVGFGVENYGTDPEVVVDNAPQDARAGRDRQLEVALDTVLARAGAPGSRRPVFGPRPNVAAAPLPPRGGG